MLSSIYKVGVPLLAFILSACITFAQTSHDTTASPLNMDAVYNRPFLSIDKMPVAIGGYIEFNTQQSSTAGVPTPFT
ncbi:MAG: hypothetical protein NTX15_01195, partial [Candidatus Kapabacteria bacterium]|nr:hypothetical protein [Candidatus Kapabacteria bacterium]